MTVDELVEKHIAVFNAHDAEGWASHYAENAVLYDPQYPEALKGRAAIRKDIEDFFKSFSDMQFRTIETIAGTDSAATQGVGSGTNTGSLELPTGTVPPTNKHVDVAYASFVKLDGAGLIVEERRYYDQAGILMQLGVMG